jgi:hypothetical protein
MDPSHEIDAASAGDVVRHRALEARLRHLESTRDGLGRSLRRAPWMALGALAAVPAGLAWGAGAALAVLALAVVSAGLWMYLAWSHRHEYAAQQDTVRQALGELGRPAAQRSIPWRVPGKQVQW